MNTYYYTQTVVYYLRVEAATADEADAQALATDINDSEVVTTAGFWEQDGYTD